MDNDYGSDTRNCQYIRNVKVFLTQWSTMAILLRYLTFWEQTCLGLAWDVSEITEMINTVRMTKRNKEIKEKFKRVKIIQNIVNFNFIHDASDYDIYCWKNSKNFDQDQFTRVQKEMGQRTSLFYSSAVYGWALYQKEGLKKFEEKQKHAKIVTKKSFDEQQIELINRRQFLRTILVEIICQVKSFLKQINPYLKSDFKPRFVTIISITTVSKENNIFHLHLHQYSFQRGVGALIVNLLQHEYQMFKQEFELNGKKWEEMHGDMIFEHAEFDMDEYPEEMDIRSRQLNLKLMCEECSAKCGYLNNWSWW